MASLELWASRAASADRKSRAVKVQLSTLFDSKRSMSDAELLEKQRAVQDRRAAKRESAPTDTFGATIKLLNSSSISDLTMKKVHRHPDPRSYFQRPLPAPIAGLAGRKPEEPAMATYKNEWAMIASAEKKAFDKEQRDKKIKLGQTKRRTRAVLDSQTAKMSAAMKVLLKEKQVYAAKEEDEVARWRADEREKADRKFARDTATKVALDESLREVQERVREEALHRLRYEQLELKRIKAAELQDIEKLRRTKARRKRIGQASLEENKRQIAAKEALVWENAKWEVQLAEQHKLKLEREEQERQASLAASYKRQEALTAIGAVTQSSIADKERDDAVRAERDAALQEAKRLAEEQRKARQAATRMAEFKRGIAAQHLAKQVAAKAEVEELVELRDRQQREAVEAIAEDHARKLEQRRNSMTYRRELERQLKEETARRKAAKLGLMDALELQLNRKLLTLPGLAT